MTENVGINIEEAIELRIVNKLTYKQIAAYFNVTPQAVHKALKNRISSDDLDIPSITKKRAQVLAHQHYRALTAISQDKLDKASAKDLAVITKLLYDQSRLENKQSTTNTAVSFARIVEQSINKDGF